MSHINTFKTEIRLDNALQVGMPLESDPGWEILRQAVETAAAELGLEIGFNIRDYYERLVRCDFSLYGPDCPRGVGVRVSRTTGAVEFLYDAYGGYERRAKQICDAVVQNFQSIALARALESLNYSVEYNEEDHPVEGRKITVKGVL
jgi:hypothetical protein